MAVTAAIIAGTAALGSAGLNAYTALNSGRGAQQATSIDEAALAQARNDALQARINAAYTTKLGQAGYTDSQGNSYHYDPGTNSWVSTLGKLPQQVQTAADQAAISRNTTDLRQAQGANARADLNAARAQPLIDAARRRLENFTPMTGSDLGSLLGETAANANTTAYRPVIQDTLRTFARTGTSAGPVLADIGRRSSADLRQGLIDARIKGLTGAADINNANRQGLQTDLSSALVAGTPQFQYPGIVPSTNSKDMLAALANRATGAAYSSALGNSAITQANAQGQAASDTLAKSIPLTNPSLLGLSQAGGSIADYLKSGTFKDLLTSLNTPSKYNGPTGSDLTGGFGDPTTLQTQLGLGSNQYVP